MGKFVTFDELKEHSTKNSLYVLIHEKGLYFLISQLIDVVTCPPRSVYDVTKFVDEVFNLSSPPRIIPLLFLSTQAEMM